MTHDRRGFTLMELLIVITVIAILVSLTAPALFRHVGDARVTAARADIATLSLALEAYSMTNGQYPTTAQGLEALIKAPAQQPIARDWRGPYIRGSVPLDPWGRAFLFESPGRLNPSAFDLYSLGKDGRVGGTGEDEDIRAWEKRP